MTTKLALQQINTRLANDNLALREANSVLTTDNQFLREKLAERDHLARTLIKRVNNSAVTSSRRAEMQAAKAKAMAEGKVQRV